MGRKGFEEIYVRVDKRDQLNFGCVSQSKLKYETQNGVEHDSLPNNFPGWLYLGNLSSFPHFGHLKPSTLPASHLRSSDVGCTSPVATVLVPQFAQIGLSSQWKNVPELTNIDKLLQFQKY